MVPRTSDVDLSKFFVYDETSPSGLRWKVDILSGVKYAVVRMHAGDIAGTLDDGYYKVKLNHKKIGCHRVIWELHYGAPDPGLMIDHIDGDGTNNRVSNLRLVSRTANMRNARQRADNQTGVTGVKLQRNTDRKGLPYYYYVAVWRTLDGKEKQKCFSVSKLGDSEAFRLACEFRAARIEELNQRGAGYTERHGT